MQSSIVVGEIYRVYRVPGSNVETFLGSYESILATLKPGVLIGYNWSGAEFTFNEGKQTY